MEYLQPSTSTEVYGGWLLLHTHTPKQMHISSILSTEFILLQKSFRTEPETSWQNQMLSNSEALEASHQVTSLS